MPRFLKTNPHNRVGNTAYGNTMKLLFVLSTDATGKVLGADKLAAFNVNDEVVLGELPEGLRITDSTVTVTTPLSASTTVDLGFKYTDGDDHTAVPQDADYFGAGIVTSSAAKLRNSTTNPSVRLPKDALLVLKLNGANNAKSGRVEVLIEGLMEG